MLSKNNFSQGNDIFSGSTQRLIKDAIKFGLFYISARDLTPESFGT